jgi:hypothetical protein
VTRAIAYLHSTVAEKVTLPVPTAAAARLIGAWDVRFEAAAHLERAGATGAERPSAVASDLCLESTHSGGSRSGTEKTTQPWASAESRFPFRCYRTLEKEWPTVRRTGATIGLISAAADR